MQLRDHRFSVALQAAQLDVDPRAARDGLDADRLDERSGPEAATDQHFVARVQANDNDCVVHDGSPSALALDWDIGFGVSCAAIPVQY